MTEEKDNDNIQREIDDIFTNYHEEIKKKQANFRSKLEDKYCRKIFDKLLLEAPLKNKLFAQNSDIMKYSS